MLVFAPFDLFGHAGTGAGAQLLADAMRELKADNRREVEPTRSSAYQDRLRFKEFAFETLADYQAWPEQARKTARSALTRGDFLAWLGGNHLSVLPVLEALGTLDNTIVIQLDAHLDIYNLADSTTAPSHGNFLLHASGPLPPILHLGSRDLFLTSDRQARHFRQVWDAAACARNWDDVLRQIRRETKGKRVWLDLDCDAIDPAFFPAVAHPQPFGLSASQVLTLMEALTWSNVAGISVSEFDPARDQRDLSLGFLMWLLEFILLRKFE